MSRPYSMDAFFLGLTGDTGDLFPAEPPVWTALDRLKEHIRRTIEPNVRGIFSPGVPLPRHAVLLPGGWITQGFEIEWGQETKGRPEVRIDGERQRRASVVCAGTVLADDQIQIGQGVVIEAGAFIKGPSIIGHDTEVRHGAYIRGDCLVGSGSVVGHATEVKHSIFLNGAKAGHFAYVGDSILGENVNLGAGTKLANLKFGAGNVVIRIEKEMIDTGRRKLGAILGHGVQTGCNSVSNPGALVGHGSVVAPNATVRPGLYPPRSVIR